MMLTVRVNGRQRGFALPTILLVSTVLLIILVASIGAAAASRVSLDSQYYNLLAKQAAQSGIARATECLKANGYVPQWETTASGRDLRPNSTCTGATRTGTGVSAYIIGDGNGPSSIVRTRYSIDAPNGSGPGSILLVVGTTELVRTSMPGSVWRTYQQTLYHRIEPPQAVSCPTGFVGVPGDSRFGTNDFCIGKYEAKNVGGKAASQAAGIPYVNIDQATAIQAAAQSCAGCQLITPNQWLTVMHNVLGVASNWSGDEVGSGFIYSGHNDNSPNTALEASTNDADGYANTGNTSGNQRRTLRLTTGEVVWDLAGNVWEWTSGSTTGGQPGASGYAWREWNAGGMVNGSFASSFPSFGTPAASAWNGASQGLGRLYSNSAEAGLRGITRGSFWNGGANTGIASMNFNDAPSTSNSSTGFRIVFVPDTNLSCSAGFIPVPGNSMFGTNNFCAGKYEAKMVGSVAVSQASGTPWTMSQATAITTANAACTGCRLMSEGEWMTVAHNIANVPSNWSGGSVGNGYIFYGHTDNSPSSMLAASASDTDGYSGTGNLSGDQRRTLTLSNGQVIWDFSGNAWEWTTGQITGGQPGAATYAWREWNTVTGLGTFNPDPFPAFGTPAASGWTSASHKIGLLYSDTGDAATRVFRRGGSRQTGVNAGIFTLSLSSSSSSTNSDYGFRLVEIK